MGAQVCGTELIREMICLELLSRLSRNGPMTLSASIASTVLHLRLLDGPTTIVRILDESAPRSHTFNMKLFLTLLLVRSPIISHRSLLRASPRRRPLA